MTKNERIAALQKAFCDEVTARRMDSADHHARIAALEAQLHDLDVLVRDTRADLDYDKDGNSLAQDVKALNLALYDRLMRITALETGLQALTDASETETADLTRKTDLLTNVLGELENRVRGHIDETDTRLRAVAARLDRLECFQVQAKEVWEAQNRRLEELEAHELERGLDYVSHSAARWETAEITNELARLAKAFWSEATAGTVALEPQGWVLAGQNGTLDGARYMCGCQIISYRGRDATPAQVLADGWEIAKARAQPEPETEQDWQEVARCIPLWNGARLRPCGGFAMEAVGRDGVKRWYCWSSAGETEVRPEDPVDLDHGPTYREAVYRLAVAKGMTGECSYTVSWCSDACRWMVLGAATDRTCAIPSAVLDIDLPADADPKLVLALAWEKHLAKGAA